MKKNAFTLIELLAVIIIMAIIALIATPQVMKIIKTSSKNAMKQGTLNVVKTIQLDVVQGQYENYPLVYRYSRECNHMSHFS